MHENIDEKDSTINTVKPLTDDLLRDTVQQTSLQGHMQVKVAKIDFPIQWNLA